MAFEDQLREDLKAALRQGDELRKSTLRMLLAAIKNFEIEVQRTAGDADVHELIRRDIKRHRESIDAFAKGNRPELAAKEEAESKILAGYLPPQVSGEEIAAEARKVIAELGAQGPRDKGKVMSHLMPQLKGKADGGEISRIVSELLG
ncbi:MAG: GatB/YqeY domain-containing protein [Chloroflexota bacterium]